MHRAQLSLRVEEGEVRDQPRVTILLDGRDLDLLVEGSEFIGFDPDEILGEGAPLVPLEQPRRVAVYRCECGLPGCGVVAPQISREGDEIVWRDARDYTGVFDGPLAPAEDLGEGALLSLPELGFDAAQYLEEVQRATADRSWESERRVTARLLKDILLASEELCSAGYCLQWVGPWGQQPEAFNVVMLDPERVQVVVDVLAPAQEPPAWAAALAESLLSKEPAEWTLTFEGNYPWPEDD